MTSEQKGSVKQQQKQMATIIAAQSLCMVYPVRRTFGAYSCMSLNYAYRRIAIRRINDQLPLLCICTQLHRETISIETKKNQLAVLIAVRPHAISDIFLQ